MTDDTFAEQAYTTIYVRVEIETKRRLRKLADDHYGGNMTAALKEAILRQCLFVEEK